MNRQSNPFGIRLYETFRDDNVDVTAVDFSNHSFLRENEEWCGLLPLHRQKRSLGDNGSISPFDVLEDELSEDEDQDAYLIW